MMEQKNLKYFKKIIETIAQKGTCDRAYVGCVIINEDNFIVSTGYNGSPSKTPHCDDVGHLMYHEHCQRTAHGELNAIINAAKNGIKIKDCTMICTHKPCYRCMQVLINTGIKTIYYFNNYKDNFQYAFENKLSLIKV